MFTRILLAADGSEHSFRAFQQAIGLLKNRQGTIDIVYVVSGTASKYDVLHHNSKEEIKKDRKEKLHGFEEELTKRQIHHDVHILHGEPGEIIVEFANENNYDFVVVGSRGLNKLQSFVLGSVSHKIAKRVMAPVLIVK
ncbi:universal stress protein [Bacillus suaedae]|uniref:Universal stress protein n=1 Tax=Halalkalibacter suaedae TaxID=2822140 RepID=A0A941AQR5_9BACI|nr:universal stress protein [Bacillus suaedae]MBP3953096.1 universal stress protein [Bacillus suaedae]